MRIALISGTFLPVVGGVEWKVHYLATEYVRRGHEVLVFTTKPRLTFAPIGMPVETTYPIVRRGTALPGFGRFGILKAGLRSAVLKHHQQKPFDVLHCHHLGYPTRVGLEVKAVTGTPVVATTCGADVQVVPEIGYGDRLKPRLDRIATYNVRHVDVVGSISSSVRADLESMGATARIVDIPNGVSWDDFQTGPSTLLRDRLGLQPDSLLVLSVGRNHIKKAYDVGIRSFARIAQEVPTAHYALVGRNSTSHQALVGELHMEGRVHLIEQMPMQDMPRVYHSADVFFNPSKVEGFAQVNAQALACGLPCVLTDAPGNRDAGDHGGAIIGRTGDEESLATCLRQLLLDGTLRGRLAEQAGEAGRKYSWSCIAEQYLEIFDQLVNRMAGCTNEAAEGRRLPTASPGPAG